MKASERLGSKINKWTILSVERAPVGKQGLIETYAHCVCECGNKKRVLLASMTSGKSKSCGCALSELLKKAKINFRHGMSRTKIHTTWAHIIQRCYDKNSPAYSKYGAKGVTMCDEWRNSFETFWQDMGEPLPGYSIDRIDNSKGYSKDNCRWATNIEQARNKKSNKVFTIDGKIKVLSEWVEITDMHDYETVNARVRRGWDIKKALYLPLDAKRGRRKANLDQMCRNAGYDKK